MLQSIALILILGLLLSGIMKKFNLPNLIGMIFVGIILGPFVLNLISGSILEISIELRQIALVVILVRAGLSLDIQDLKKVSRPAILMCFIPATFELIAVTVFSPMLFDMTYLEAALLGAVLAAVSPAVVVPRMLKLMENGYGKDKSIPQLIMAGASVDDIYVIILFTSFLNMYNGGNFNIINFVKLPVSVVLGILLGVITGIVLTYLFKKVHMRDTVKILLIFSSAFLFLSLENIVRDYVPVSGLLAVMALGGTVLKINEQTARRLSEKFSKIWVCAELFLFVLVGAAIDINYISKAGFSAVILICSALLVRMIGVFVCLIKTKLNKKERIFCAVAYLPKATVQAAICGIPLTTGVAAGNTILVVAVLAILITAPIGALGIDLSYEKLLNKNE